MSSGAPKPGQPTKSGQGMPSSFAPSGQHKLLDKLNGRRATPDSTSEAIASSDDEAGQEPAQSFQGQQPPRRQSWMNEPPQAGYHPRKDSFASATLSPITSHTSTSPAEANSGPWGPTTATMNRSHAASVGWAQPWNNNRQEPPSRLAEVLPSPSGNSYYGHDGNVSQTSPGPRDFTSISQSQIPFAIPDHPTPKYYRSNSYSVGQLDPDSSALPTTAPASGIIGSRGRGPAPYPGLHHRPSRPSLLNEVSTDGGMLGKVKEVDDDDTAYTDMGAKSQQQSADAKHIEYLYRENARLRQQHNANRMRPRASTGYGNLGNGYTLRDSVPEESSDFAVDDELNDVDGTAKRGFTRRMSEFDSGPFRQSFTLDGRPVVENRPLENVKKAIWSSSQAFNLGEQPQSRRHSFADVPTRQASVGSIGDQPLPQDHITMDDQHGETMNVGHLGSGMLAHVNPSNYYNGPGMAAAQPPVIPSGYGAMYQSAYGMQPPFSPNRLPSPHRAMYGIPQPRHAQRLHVVLFKCSRADVFYIQEDTGLTVKAGDLVIVDADRGTDLGTVSRENVDWHTAKQLKEYWAEEHYKWHLMFSQKAALNPDGTGAGLMAQSNGMYGGAVGGMGPPNQHHTQEPNNGELKPKLIRRHALNHEISALREKEGSEAKAKRVCQSKVKEHGLNMEILDAEFQLDWKKLTFYYFADSYINFNSLVTDLFKIYKTRIWMSAINPASFANPTIGQTPSGIGPGAVGVGRNAPGDRRQNPQQQQQQQQQESQPPSFPVSAAAARPFAPERGASAFMQPPAPYSYNYNNAFNNTPRPGAPPFVPEADPHANAFPTNEYTQQRSRAGYPPGFPAPESAASQHETPISPLTSRNGGWISSFQGLSLNGNGGH